MPDSDPMLTAEIVGAIRGGDRDAFDALFKRVGGKVHVYVLARMGARLREVVEPEDILQEVYTQAYRAFDDFVDGGRGSMAKWLVGIAANQVRAHYKHHFQRHKRDQGRVVRFAASGDAERSVGAPQPVSPHPTPSRIIARNEAVLRMAAALDALPDHERELVLAHVYEERSLRDLAREKDVPHTTLAYRVGQSLERMRASLDGFE